MIKHVGTETSAEKDSSMVVDYGSISSNDRFQVNPLYRMRNEANHVQIYGQEIQGANHAVEHAWGITLALFNGERTIRDVAELVRPFVPDSEQEHAEEKALVYTKTIASFFSKTQAERDGDGELLLTGAPSEALLIPQSLTSGFRGVPIPQYNPKDFLPENAYPESEDIYGDLRHRAPTNIVWHLTSKCVTNCRYCYLNRRAKAEPLPKKRVLEVIDEAQRMGVFYIMTGGGDVLLYPDLIEVLHTLKGRGFLPVTLPTKAMVTKDMARQLAETGMLWEIQFSVDSTVPEIADWLVQEPGFHQRTLESIENCLEAGLHVGAKAVITPYNILTIPRLYRELRARGVAPVRLACYVRSGYHHTEDLFNHQESYDWLERELNSLREEFPSDYVGIQNGGPMLEPQSQEAKESAWHSRSACTAGRTTMMICADGKVIPCEMMEEKAKNFCGDLRVQSLEEIWLGDELAKRTLDLPRDKFHGTPCFDCDEREECQNKKGYCIRDTAQYYGSLYTPGPNCPQIDLPFVRRT